MHDRVSSDELFRPSRRLFLQTSLAGLASLSAGGILLAKEEPFAPVADELLPRFNDGNPDTLFLTWQRDPTTTITATWVGEDMADDLVEVRVARLGEKNWQKVRPVRVAYPVRDLKVYRAEATGLEPGTQYQLQIGPSKESLRFQTMPAKATNSFTFVSGGDSGSGPNARVSNLLAAKQDPMFAMIVGDIAYEITSSGVRPSANLRFLKNYREDMIDSEKRLIPIVPGIGNHEVTRVNGVRTAPFFLPLYGGLYSQEKTYATLDFGDYLSLVLLDTGHLAPYAGEQASWLDHELGQRTERPHLIVAQHVPSYPSYRPYESGESPRQHWVPLFEKHNVDIVLEHHDHTFKRTFPMKDGLQDKNGLIYLGDGSWGALRSLQDVEPRPYLATASSNYHVTLHRLEGDRRFHMALTHSGRVVDICSTTKRPTRPMGRGA